MSKRFCCHRHTRQFAVHPIAQFGQFGQAAHTLSPQAQKPTFTGAVRGSVQRSRRYVFPAAAGACRRCTRHGDDAMLRRVRFVVVGEQVTEILVAHVDPRPVCLLVDGRKHPFLFGDDKVDDVLLVPRAVAGFARRGDAHTGGVDDLLDELVGGRRGLTHLAAFKPGLRPRLTYPPSRAPIERRTIATVNTVGLHYVYTL